MTGFKVFKEVLTLRVHTWTTVVMWQRDRASPVALKPDGGEYMDESRYLTMLEPGTYHARELANGIIFSHCTEDMCREYRDALEIDGFPIPTSLRVTGFDRSLSALGIERGRLPHMYKVGSDTSATMLLLLHGASVSYTHLTLPTNREV